MVVRSEIPHFFTGYDKLKPFCFPICGAVDGFSRKVLRVDVIKSNNSPETVANVHLECVRQHKGCPLQTRSDCGTESRVIAAAQFYFRSNDDYPLQGKHAHCFGTSHHNQRIENWNTLFKDLVEEKQLNLCDEFTMECLWFSFNGVLQDSLDEVQLYWSLHYLRFSRHKTTAGVPDILLTIPKEFGGFDCHVPVSDEIQYLQEVQFACTQREGIEDESQ